MEPTSPRSYIPLRRIDWRIVISLIALNTVCLFFYRQLDYVANAHHRAPLLTFAEEAIGGVAGLAVFPLIYLVAINFPLLSAKWRRNLAAHLLAVCLISLVHTSVIAALRVVLFPVLGFSNESYGYMPARYPMEFSHLFIYYWFAVSLIYFFHEIRFARERELRQVKLEKNLAEARLSNLRLQLEPHFLFNALNAISAAVYENPRAADEMIGRLGDMLRQLLKDDRSQVVRLAREIENLQLYTRIMEVRLEDRLELNIDIDEGAKLALVPQMILQPLVENAIRHGMDAMFEVRIVIEGRIEQGSLHLRIRDHGMGIDDPKRLKIGIGLRNTRERLERLYGDEQSFELRNAPDGGAVAEIRVPFRASGEREAHAAPPLAVESEVR
ncbi:MAG: histidine kinase [Bryobacteraceae bacterium]